MKKKLFLISLVAVLGIALAQAVDAPKDWGEALQYLVALIPAIIAAIAKGPKYWMSLLRSGTFWAAIGGLVTAVKLYANGQIGLEALVFAVIGALTAILLRKGLIETEEKVASAPMIRK